MRQKSANPSLPHTPITPEQHSKRGPITLIVIILLAVWIQTILRLCAAAQVLLQPTIENQFSALIHWRAFDLFTGWIILGIFAIAGIRRAKEGGISFQQIALTLGMTALTASLLLEQIAGQTLLEFPTSVLLAIAAILISYPHMRELASAVAPSPNSPTPRGLNIEQLWRGITLQWIFLWIAAEVTLRFHFRKDGLDAQPKAREFLFVLPVVGIMINMLMALGVKWWNSLRGGASQPRLRAWLISIALVNGGAVAIAVGFRFGALFTITGEILLLLGTALYLLGFPNNAWSNRNLSDPNTPDGGGKIVPLAFILLFLAIAMMATENFFPNDVPTLYAYAWHHLFAAAPILWLVGFGGMAARRFATSRTLAGTNAVALTAILLFLFGVLTLAATFLLGIHDRDTLRGLFLGATLEAAGLLLFSLLFIRISRGLK